MPPVQTRRIAWFCLVMAACGDGGGSSGGPDAGAPPPAWLVSSEILVHGVGVTNKMCQTAICPHNENTDMIVFKGATYLVHRTAVSQILGDNCALHVYKTTDGGVTFTHLAQINPVTGRDLRDPAFYVVGDQLYMKALTRLPVTLSRDS